MNVCFICHANICRSFVAERLFNAFATEHGRKDIKAFSRGIYASSSYEIPTKIKTFLEKNSVPWQGHSPTFFGKEDASRADILLVMTHEQFDFIMDKFPQYADKIFLLLDYALGKEEDLPDPILQRGQSFEKSMNKLKGTIKLVFQRISS